MTNTAKVNTKNKEKKMKGFKRTENIYTAMFLAFVMVAFSGAVAQSQMIDTLWCEDWESGWNGWYASNGVWDVGVPSSPGPDSAYSGDNCAGTILDGNYPTYTNTRLISPPFTVPSADENPRLRFWHWFLIHGSDHGVVEIKVEHPDSNWVEISDHCSRTGGPWTPYIIPLSPYEGESVRIAFHFISDHAYENAGWYVDDILITIRTSVDNLYESVPSNFTLAGNYPNPFNPTTTVNYLLPTPANVRLDIYNLLGQRVATLFEGRQQAGEHAMTWDASGFPSGVYFARLKTAERSESIKMLFLK